MIVLVTGAAGFVGRNLCEALHERADVGLLSFDAGSPPAVVDDAARSAEIVYHLAGVNRPADPAQFDEVNRGLTAALCDRFERSGRRPVFVLASSTQAELGNPYGRSKRAAEEAVRAYCQRTGARGVVHRFKNLFGKWSRPNYNSVTATFCHNIARGLPVEISDPAREVELTYIDDVVAALVRELDARFEPGGFVLAPPLPSQRTSLGDLARLIASFQDHRENGALPDFSTPFVRALYATYLSHVPPQDWAYALSARHDPRGSLAEFVKSPGLGQVFVSRTRPGAMRGNHYHHTKTEKFLVLEGDALIRLRPVDGTAVMEFRVSGEECRVVDIPPGHAHSIENVGSRDLVTLFWASEMFDPARPDTVAALAAGKQGTSA
jgi:UDP-2-acetamido-2,6-beta-L-arabino-hexul-4-ose reductase